ncbi:conserved hypothetical protein [Nitrosotalea sinensis]|uniref:Uncharacterized protein n=1 Tax=Nitrosotalea sinensis TaxID=1499975 RepID=A0A2H1EF77_9ARCH|nr:hypothetical protein [Candidatus Nitrosotalea sinensis]SHO43444.1 conserved hypothetical protein [Candidatus Nitrosotalea sinensis]
MIGKLVIIGIIIAVIAILVPNASKMFSAHSLDEVKERIDRATSDKQDNLTASNTNKTVDTNNIHTSLVPNTNSSGTTVYQLAPQFVTRQNYIGQVFAKNGNTCQISVPDLAQTINGKKQLTGIIQLDNCSSNLGDPVQVVQLTVKPDSPQVNVSSGLEVTPYSDKSSTSTITTPGSLSGISQPSTSTSPQTAQGTTLPTLPPYYDTIKLTVTNQGTGATLNFVDSSGQTKSVLVTMKNSDSVIFSGTFYSSQFTADVKDVPDTPHIIEMTIDNTVYGTLHASAYAPSNMQNSTITGILSQ